MVNFSKFFLKAAITYKKKITSTVLLRKQISNLESEWSRGPATALLGSLKFEDFLNLVVLFAPCPQMIFCCRNSLSSSLNVGTLHVSASIAVTPNWGHFWKWVFDQNTRRIGGGASARLVDYFGRFATHQQHSRSWFILAFADMLTFYRLTYYARICPDGGLKLFF